MHTCRHFHQEFPFDEAQCAHISVIITKYREVRRGRVAHAVVIMTINSARHDCFININCLSLSSLSPSVITQKCFQPECIGKSHTLPFSPVRIFEKPQTSKYSTA